MERFEIPHSSNPELIFLKLQKLPSCVWLDSGKPWSELGRYDIFSAKPKRSLSGSLERIRHEINQTPSIKCEDLPFCGGWIGYLSYACSHNSLNVVPTKQDSLKPCIFHWFDWAFIIDHQIQKSFLVFLDDCDPELKQEVFDLLSTPDERSKTASIDHTYECSDFFPDESKEKYLTSLEKIREYLLAGDCYQVNYTQRFSANFKGSPIGAYLNLRKAVPSPFSAFLPTHSGAILSISPERFIQLNDRKALTQPIKGTAPRGKSTEEDENLKKDLQNSSKNRAENVMIVDLLRNDFSQNCVPYSVKVPELFKVQSFKNVHHLVSDICGELEQDVSHFDFILSCFPGGSITGAPKKRSMEIIEELESYSRSIYCGSIGYVSTNKKSDFNIAIRTLLVEEEKLYGWAGGGIVLDSIPEEEYEESLFKIGSLLKAVRRSN